MKISIPLYIDIIIDITVGDELEVSSADGRTGDYDHRQDGSCLAAGELRPAVQHHLQTVT